MAPSSRPKVPAIEPMVMTRPRFRAIIPGATSRQQRMHDSRLRSSTARMSARGMPTQSSGLGRPPRPTPVPPAPMSPPALATRTSMRPKRERTAALGHAIEKGDGEVVLPRGDYLITRPLLVPLDRFGRFHLSGSGGLARLI